MLEDGRIYEPRIMRVCCTHSIVDATEKSILQSLRVLHTLVREFYRGIRITVSCHGRLEVERQLPQLSKSEPCWLLDIDSASTAL